MYKLAALGFANVALAQTWTCINGEDTAAPYVLPKGTLTGCKYCAADEIEGVFAWSCLLPTDFGKDIPASSFTNGNACMSGKA